MNSEEMKQTFYKEVWPILKENYNRGFLDGLKVAENIAGWLTSPNQSARVKEVEQWARDAIRAAKENLE